MALNIPDGGIPVDDYVNDTFSKETAIVSPFSKIYKLHISLVELLKRGILQMNKKNIYHCDIKDSNVLVDITRVRPFLKTRLIDWGLSTEYIPFKNQHFPSTWRNRPFQYNVPFSVILFTDDFVEKYTKYLHDGGKPEKTQLKPFVVDYIHYWIKKIFSSIHFFSVFTWPKSCSL